MGYIHPPPLGSQVMQLVKSNMLLNLKHLKKYIWLLIAFTKIKTDVSAVLLYLGSQTWGRIHYLSRDII